VLLGLSGGQKLGLLAISGVFIAFALASSFLLPRRNPDFPGERGMKLFVATSVALFVAMVAGMVLLAREDETSEPPHGGEAEEQSAPLLRAL